jgi:hypothetical protein
MRNISGKSFRGNQNIFYYPVIILFFENHDSVKKKVRPGKPHIRI